MGERERETITKYLGDIHALESHVREAFEKQERLLGDHPGARAKIQEFRTKLDRHLEAIKARMDALGGSPTHPVKTAVAAAAGIAAGLYDKARTEEASKDLRDDYTALSHLNVSYVMLHTTALGLGDRETADLAKRHLTDGAGFVMAINDVIPGLVLTELRQDKLQVDPSVLEEAMRAVHEVWEENPRQENISARTGIAQGPA